MQTSITHQVINWTFSDRFARLKLSVGVAFGSDTEQVLNILLEVANEDNSVVQYPAPRLWGGETSLSMINPN